jgi:hypothetical protein
MTDYQNEKAAERWAHKYGRWIVYGFLPAIVVAYCFFTMVLPILRYAVTGILLQ